MLKLWLYSSNIKDNRIAPLAKPAKEESKHNIRRKLSTGLLMRLMRRIIQTETIEAYYRNDLGDQYWIVQGDIFKEVFQKKKDKFALLKMLHNVNPTQSHIAKIRVTTHSECHGAHLR
jgi:hypothetical protein